MTKFRTGRSGNPAGRPRGIEDKRTALRALLDPHAPKLIAKIVAKALKGDTTALRICIDRLIPPIKARDSAINIGKIDGTLADRGKAVFDALSEGRVSPDEASSLMQALAAQARIVVADDLERRIKALEDHRNKSARK